MKIKHLLVVLTCLSTFISCSSAEIPSLSVKATPERSKIHSSSSQEVIFQVELKGQDRKSNKRLPLNLAVVLDRSTSMDGEKLEQAKQAACVVVDQLAVGDYFSLIAYGTEAHTLIPSQRITHKKSVKAKIRAIQTNGSTALYAGVEAGAAELRKKDSHHQINRVILLSDGIANVGPSQPGELAQLGTRLSEQGIRVTTIGLGQHYNEDLMMALAEASSANYYYVQDAEKLPGIFQEELGYLQSIVARHIRLIIDLPQELTPIEIIGHPDVIFKNKRAEIILSEHYSSQRRSFLVRCQIPSTKKSKIELAKITAIYQDENSETQRQDHAQLYLEQTHDLKSAEASLNQNVSQEVALARNSASRARALHLADQGKPMEAVQVLQELVQSNAALPAAARSEKLDRDIISLTATASALQKEGQLDKAERKAFQYENYRQKKQKE
jgi:Ca-activated chloride channel homolog